MNEKDPLQSSIDEKMNHMVQEKEKQKERKKVSRGAVGGIIAVIMGIVFLLRLFM